MGDICLRDLQRVPQLTPAPLDFWIEVFAPPIMALAYAMVFWFYMRGIVRRGRRLTPIMRTMLGYGTVWMLGVGYMASIGKAMGWTEEVWVVLIVGWSGLVGLFALWRHKRKERAENAQKRSAQRSGGDIK